MIVLEENRAREGHEATQAGRPRPAGLPYKRSPPAPVFCRQASLSFLYLCAQVFCAQNHRRHSQPSQA
jgi:hypothetical protein